MVHIRVYLFNLLFGVFFFGKLQITPLKFGGFWILYFEISKFKFYFLKLEGV